eukprot:Phypoly_transcript_03910.p1 GENE.Phypoly_transcript_03910~~Phypoly_transcript_03910.p1  ORF type:complete len:438 (+),score=45.87 Phypoly_transcript_03910:273-1586(+)
MKRSAKLVGGLLSIGATVGVVKWRFNKQEKPYIHENNNPKKIAVIGAGVSGIVATKWLAEAGHKVKTFEQSSGIGGNWHYTPLTDPAHEVSSSCYENLTSITTSNSMSFEGFPMPKRYGVFPSHSHIHKYITDYCRAYNLWDCFVLNARVTSVVPVSGGYRVTVTRNGVVTSELFDAVAVCNGHNANPYWPAELTKDLQQFSGDVIHSRSYRSPSHFRGKKVLVLGGGVSGKQIALDVSFKADLVAISTNRSTTLSAIYKGKPGWLRVAKFTNSVVQIAPPLSSSTPFTGKDVRFIDGSVKSFDAIIVCSGYRSSFPFLDQSLVDSIVKFPDNCSHPSYLWLYKHTFPIPESDGEVPTLAFIGMMDVTDASLFAMADTQAKWFSLLLSGKTRLPPRAQMHAETQEWLKGVNLRYHPMAVSESRAYCAQVRVLIEANK